jgi:endo-alpha-1,4-polygalactosaminidase (GH114 family)
VPLSTIELASVIVIVIAYVAVTEVAKYWFYERKPKKGGLKRRAVLK